MGMSLTQQIINALIVSVPEEFFIAVLILVILKKSSFLTKEHWKENLFRIMVISVIPMAIVSNAIDYVAHNLHIESLQAIKPLIGILGTAVTIMGICGVKSKKEFFKIILFTFIGFILFILTELITAVVIKYGLQDGLIELNKSPYLNFVMFIPERLAQYGFITYIFLKKNGLSQINISKVILQNKLLRNISIMFSLIDIFILILITKYVFFSRLLEVLPLTSQLFIVVIGLSLVIINVLAILLTAICIYPEQKYLRKYGKEVN